MYYYSATKKQRAFSQPIYLIRMEKKTSDYEREFLVLGTTGNKYHIIIGENSSCSCPDFEDNGNICKHLYFIVLRVLKGVTVRRKYNKDTLRIMFDNIPKFLDNDLFVDKKAYDLFHNVNVKPVDQKFDDLCPVCLEDVSRSQKLNYCKYECGKSIHSMCFNMWSENTGIMKCLFCRCDWPNDAKNTLKYDGNDDDDIEFIDDNKITKMLDQNKTDVKQNKKYMVKELQAICKSNNLSVYGKKSILLDRLKQKNLI